MDPEEQGRLLDQEGDRPFYAYKLHAKMDVDNGLIRDLETTPENVHDSRVGLSESGKVVYREKGYFGIKPRGYDATMRQGPRSPAGCTGPAVEPTNKPEEGSRGEAVRGDQAGVRLGSCVGDDGAPGSGEDGIRVSLLLPPPAEYFVWRLTA